MATTADVAKQLDFGGGDPRAPHPPPAALDTPGAFPTPGPLVLPDDADLASMGAPSVDGFRRVLAALDNACDARFGAVIDRARDVAPGQGESDLRRLKRQFTSLKNTFTLYDVKDGFIDGLAEGGPDGSERARLADLDAQTAEFSAAAKAAKTANGAALDTLRGLVDHVCDAAAAFEAERDAAAAALEEAEEAGGGGGAGGANGDGPSASTPAPPPPPDVAAALAAEADAARELEARIAAAAAEEDALARGAAADAADADALAAEAARLGRAASGDGAAAAAMPPFASADARLADAAAWCEAATALLAALGGVEVASVAADDDGGDAADAPTAAATRLTLRLTPCSDMCDGGGERESSAQPPATARHTLTLRVAPGAPPTVASASLAPPTLPVADVAAATAASPAPLAAAVGEVMARLAAHLRRTELLEEAAAAYALTPPPAGRDGDLIAVLPGSGVEAAVRVPAGWPRAGARLEITRLTAPPGGAGLDTAAVLAALAPRAEELGAGSVNALLAAVAGQCGE